MKTRQILILALLIVSTVCLMLGFIVPGIGEDYLGEQIGLAAIPFVLGLASIFIYVKRIKKKNGIS